jgi:S1-C subfamily serine protease
MAVFGPIPEAVGRAQAALRERLFPVVEQAIPQAMALREARRYAPSPAVNLVGVGIGEKVTSGRPTGELCVKVLVARKYPKARIRPRERIPPAVDGIPTDIEGVGYPRKLALPNRLRHRPVVGGISVGLDRTAVPYRFAGTLGAVVRDPTGALYALSNNHVLADENRAPLGSPVIQPGTLDGGESADRVGALSRFVPLRFGNRRNWMDAAIARFDPDVAAEPEILGIGRPLGIGRVALHVLVRKSGRTTGLTEGIVRAIRFDVVNVRYDQGMVRMDDTIVIRPTEGDFSRPGDSGSVVVDPQGRVVGLLFAGSDVVTFAVPIRRVLRRFGVWIAE